MENSPQNIRGYTHILQCIPATYARCFRVSLLAVGSYIGLQLEIFASELVKWRGNSVAAAHVIKICCTGTRRDKKTTTRILMTTRVVVINLRELPARPKSRNGIWMPHIKRRSRHRRPGLCGKVSRGLMATLWQWALVYPTGMLARRAMCFADVLLSVLFICFSVSAFSVARSIGVSRYTFVTS